jgi:hypothetical protein
MNKVMQFGGSKATRSNQATAIFQERAADLGQSTFQTKLDAAINVSPASKEFWNEPKYYRVRQELKRTIANGGNYKALIKKKIWPGPLQTQVLAVADLLHHCARYGKIALILPKDKAKITKDMLKGLSVGDQARLARKAAIERAFIKEYQLRKKLRSFDQAWNQLIADKAFIRMISLTGRKGFDVQEASLRKKYGLTQEQNKRRAYLADAFRHVSNQARLAGFSTEAINNARQSLNLPTSTMASPVKTTPSLRGFGAAITRARILRTAKEKAKEDERRKRKRDEEEKKRMARKAKQKQEPGKKGKLKKGKKKA